MRLFWVTFKHCEKLLCEEEMENVTFFLCFFRKGWSLSVKAIKLIWFYSLSLFHHLLTYLLKCWKVNHGQSVTTSPPKGLHGQPLLRGRKIRTTKTRFKPSWIVFGIGGLHCYGCKSKQKSTFSLAQGFLRESRNLYIAIPVSWFVARVY